MPIVEARNPPSGFLVNAIEKQSVSEPTTARGQGRLQAELETPQPTLAREFIDFLRANKKWWLLPILFSLLLVGLFVYVAMSPAAPLVYPF